MSVALSTVRTHVRSNLDEATAADWTNAEIDRLINHRYHQVVTAVMTVFEDYYVTTDNFNTTADQQEYGSSDGLATDIFKLRRVEVNYNPSASSSAPTRCLPLPQIDAVRRDLGFTNSNIGLKTFSNAHYYTYGYESTLKIGFIPIPDSGGTAAGKVWYIQKQSDLSADTDTLNLPYVERYWKLVSDSATGDALRFGQQDTPEANEYDRKFDRDIQLMQEELEDKIAEEGKTVLDVTGEYLDFGGLSY